MSLSPKGIRILRSRIDTSRIVQNPKEKEELLRIGALLDHDVAEVRHGVQRSDETLKYMWLAPLLDIWE
jgi:hypothetical protein